MPDGREPATIRVVPRIADVPAEAWDRLTDGRDPFVSHAFLSALEDSGCVGPGTSEYHGSQMQNASASALIDGRLAGGNDCIAT